MSKLALAVIAGSPRAESLNLKLATAMAGLVADRFEPHVIRIDDLPFYTPELDADRPASVKRFAAAMKSADALLIVTPEYNRSLPAVLKNAIDWGSRPMTENVFRGKPAAISGASPGAIGAAVAQQHLRQIVGILGAHVMGGEAYIAFKPGLIGEDGDVADESARDFLKAYMDRFADFAARLTA